MSAGNNAQLTNFKLIKTPSIKMHAQRNSIPSYASNRSTSSGGFDNVNFVNDVDLNSQLSNAATTIELQLSANNNSSNNSSDNQRLLVTPSSNETLDVGAGGASPTSSSVRSLDVMQSADSDAHFAVKWTDLSYVVRSPWYTLSETRLPILDSLSGSFRTGELTAILGPSGSGKSTLVNCLLGRVDPASGLCGETRVSYFNKTVERERRQKRPMKIALIPQEDHLLDSLTVRESMLYASRIKNVGLSIDEHEANVQRVLTQLTLKQCENTRCGSLSGGQYKRVSIAQELLAWPDILVLDEPTSGLDSITCFQAISALQQLVRTSPHPLAVVLTIHQPDVEVFALFDKVYVLARGGKAIYEGGPGEIFDAITDGCEQVREQRLAIERRANAKQQGAKLVTSLAQFEAQRILGGQRTTGSNNALTNNNKPDVIVDGGDEFANAVTNDENNDDDDDDDDFRTTINLHLPKADDAVSIAESVRMRALGIYEAYPQNLNELERATRAQIGNPARLVVSVAAEDFGFELISTMNARQRQRHRSKLSLISTDLFNENRKVVKLDKLLSLKLNNARVSKQRPASYFWHHMIIHTQRSWTTIVRDPMLCSIQIALHILVPLMISYCFQKHSVDACPQIEKFDLIEEAYAKNGTSILNKINSEARSALETEGYFFIQLYVIIFAAICGNALTYPLSMRVLLKEYRNGWYSAASYFVGRTLADIPILAANVVLALGISYYLTGQAHSDYEWRFITIASLAVLATLVAQTQGLWFGAILMESPQSTVFVAPASTAPLVIISGFLLRLESLPRPLQLASKLSYFTHLLTGAFIGRYGFNKCNCNSTLFDDQILEDNSTSTALENFRDPHDIPPSARNLIDIWVETFKNEYNATQTPDLIGNLMNTISRARTFGYEVNSCDDIRPFAMVDNNLHDSDLAGSFIALILMLIIFRIITFATLRWTLARTV